MRTLCHSCEFASQPRVLKTFPDPGCLCSEDRVVCLQHFLVNLYIYIHIYIYIYVIYILEYILNIVLFICIYMYLYIYIYIYTYIYIYIRYIYIFFFKQQIEFVLISCLVVAKSFVKKA